MKWFPCYDGDYGEGFELLYIDYDGIPYEDQEAFHAEQKRVGSKILCREMRDDE